MRPLGDPTSVSTPSSTNSSPLSSRDSSNIEERRSSNGAASTPYSNGASNGRSTNTAMVLARRNVNTLTAVQAAAAGAAGSLQSRDELTDVVVAELRVGPADACKWQTGLVHWCWCGIGQWVMNAYCS